MSGTPLLTLLVVGPPAVCRAWIGPVPCAGSSGPDMVPMLFPMLTDESSSPRAVADVVTSRRASGTPAL